MEIKINQNTEDWQKLRRGPRRIRLGASEIGNICNVDTFNYPWDLYLVIIGIIIIEISEEQQKIFDHGHLSEPVILKLYENITGNKVSDGNYWLHSNPKLRDYYGCSPDAIIEYDSITKRERKNGEKPFGLVEAKAPIHKLYDDVKPAHMCQMMYQMWVTGASYCDYVVGLLDHETPELTLEPKLFIRRIEFNSKFFNDFIYPRILNFTTSLIQKKPYLDKSFYSEKERIQNCYEKNIQFQPQIERIKIV